MGKLTGRLPYCGHSVRFEVDKDDQEVADTFR